MNPTLSPVLLAGRLMPWLEQRLSECYELHILPDEAGREAFLREEGGRFSGLVTSAGGIGAPASLIAALPSLRVISSFGVGLDRIALPAARERGIAVGYTPEVLNACVADMAFALLLDVARRVSAADRFVRAGRWAAGAGFGLGRKVSGARLGIVGLGRIGQTIARRAAGFDMAVRYHSRRPVVDAPWPHEPDLLALAHWADYLVVITSGGAGTRHLIDAAVLDALGPQGFLVNVARGSVVDEQALVRALLERRIAGAGLDVYEHEPAVPAELLQLDNVVLLPHVASATQETRQAMAELTLANLAAGLAGDPLPAAIV
jgi:hydroxypyruvate reductase